MLFTADDPMLPPLQSRVPALTLQAVGDDVYAIRGDRFLRLLCNCFSVHNDQRPLAAQATSWRPESVGRAFMALVEAGLPDVQCGSLQEFWSMCDTVLRSELQHGDSTDLVLGLEDVYFHQAVPAPAEEAPLVLVPFWMTFSIGQLCDDVGIPIGYATYYGFSATFLRESRGPGSLWQQDWSALRLSLVGTVLNAGASDRMVIAPTASFLRSAARTWCGGLLAINDPTDCTLQLLHQAAMVLKGTEASKCSVAQDYFLRVLGFRSLGTDSSGDPAFQLRFPTSSSIFARLGADSYEAFEHFRRLLKALGESESTFIPSLEKVERTLLELAPIVSASGISGQSLGEVVEAYTSAIRAHGLGSAQGLINSRSASQPSGDAPAIYDQGTAKAAELAIRSSEFQAEAVHIDSIMGERTDPYWKLLVLLHVMVWAGSDEPRHQLLTQQLWGKAARLSSHHHPVFSTLNEIKMETHLFVSLYLVFGEDLGRSSVTTAAKSFKLSKRTFDLLLKGEWGSIHFLDDLLIPIKNALVTVGKSAPTGQTVWLSQQHIPKLRTCLQRLEHLTSCTDTDGDLSATSLIDSLEALLIRGDSLGEHNPAAASFRSSAQSIFNDAMAAVGAHLVFFLTSKDCGDAIRASFVPSTNIDILARVEALTKGTEGIIGIAEAMPDFMDRITGGQYSSPRPNQNPAQQGVTLPLPYPSPDRGCLMSASR